MADPVTVIWLRALVLRRHSHSAVVGTHGSVAGTLVLRGHASAAVAAGAAQVATVEAALLAARALLPRTDAVPEIGDELVQKGRKAKHHAGRLAVLS